METNTHLLQGQDFIDPEMVEASFQFWFNNHNEIRSPFPSYMHDCIKASSLARLMDWAGKLSAENKKDLADEVIVERFEEILFEEGMKLAQTEDEKISLFYPFMLRTGDLVNDGTHGQSRVLSRTMLKEGDQVFIVAQMKSEDKQHEWETKFEMPE